MPFPSAARDIRIESLGYEYLTEGAYGWISSIGRSAESEKSTDGRTSRSRMALRSGRCAAEGL
jgi:hypothetical protein